MAVRDSHSSPKNNNSDFSAMEKQYCLLNAELDVKVGQLFNEADEILQKSQIFSKNGNIDVETENGCEVLVRSQVTSPQVTLSCGVLDTVRKGASGNSKFLDDMLSESSNQLSMKAQNRCLKARLRAQQEEAHKMISTLKNHHEENAQLKKRVQELEEERSRLSRLTCGHSNHLDKIKRSLDETRTHCDVLEAERNALKKEAEAVKRTVTQRSTELKSSSTLLHKSQDEVERLKGELERLRSCYRDNTASMQRTIDQLSRENRKLERQKEDLITAFKKQLKLIDVLKRQKMLIEASKCLQLTEEEFLKSLDLQS